MNLIEKLKTIVLQPSLYDYRVILGASINEAIAISGYIKKCVSKNTIREISILDNDKGFNIYFVNGMKIEIYLDCNGSIIFEIDNVKHNFSDFIKNHNFNIINNKQYN